MKTERFRQYALLEINTGNTLICWLPDDTRLVAGSVLTIKELGKRRWRVVEPYATTIQQRPERHWKVGGLA